MKNFLEKQTYMIYNQTEVPLPAGLFSPFALGDALIREANQEDAPAFLHFWPLPETVILGMVDMRLPYLQDGIRFLQEKGYAVAARNSGGLAVVSDAGILNFSLVISEEEEGKISIDEGYERMLQLMQQVFAPYGKEIEAYEISTSYCPGDFDLSIDGKKFAGIAQRRFKKGIAVMIYLSVEGNQQQRGELIRSFYEKGLRGEETRWDFPDVDPESMANLSDLLGTPLTVPQVQDRILETLAANGNHFLEPVYSDSLLQEYETALEKMQKRNQRISDLEKEE